VAIEVGVRNGGAFGLGGYQWAFRLGESRITITCHNAADVGKPDAAVYARLAGHIPCPDCGALGGTSCFARSPERGPHPARMRAASRLNPVREPFKGKEAQETKPST
jgi:hypothetical protein